MLLEVLCSLLLQAPPGAVPYEASVPALAAKAAGAPGYGLQITTRSGKVLMTSLRFASDTRKAQVTLYRINGPAGWGPYRSGLERSMTYLPAPPVRYAGLHPCWSENHFDPGHPVKGSAADEAGLVDRHGYLRVDGVDGSNFGWDLDALIFHITQSPTMTVQTVKLPDFFSPSYKTYPIKNRKVETPPDPADGTGVLLPPSEQRAPPASTPLHKKRQEALC